MNKPYEDHVSTVRSHEKNMTLKEAEEHFYFFISWKVGINGSWLRKWVSDDEPETQINEFLISKNPIQWKKALDSIKKKSVREFFAFKSFKSSRKIWSCMTNRALPLGEPNVLLWALLRVLRVSVKARESSCWSIPGIKWLKCPYFFTVYK